MVISVCEATQIIRKEVKEMKKPEIIAVWGNPKFASDFAYNFARRTRKRTLICDLDFLNPSLDILLNVPINPLRAMGDLTGVFHMLEAAENNFLVQAMYDQFSVKRREAPNLHVMTGVYNLADYEYVGMDLLRKVITEARNFYELVVLVVNQNPYDACTALAFNEADLVLHPSGTDALSIRYFNNFVYFFADKQQVSVDKFKYVAYLDKPPLADKEFLRETTFGSFECTVSNAEPKKMQAMYGVLFQKLKLITQDNKRENHWLGARDANWCGGMKREGVTRNAGSSYAE